MKEILYQVEVEGGDEIEAALRLLMEIDLDGKIITLDAKLTQRKIVNHIVEEGGDYIRDTEGESPSVAGCDTGMDSRSERRCRSEKA